MLQNCRDEVLGLASAVAQLPVGLAGAGIAVVSTAEVAPEPTVTAANLTNAFDEKAERRAGYSENAGEGVARRKTTSIFLFEGMQWAVVVWCCGL